MTSHSRYLRWRIAVRNAEAARIMAEAHRRRLIADRNVWIALACLDGGAALGAAGFVDMHLALGLVTLAAIFAQIAAGSSRRADAILPRAAAADLAEGGDIPWAEAA